MLHHINWKLNTIYPPWPKFSAACLIIFSLYLFAHPRTDQYFDLLAVNSGAGRSRLVQTLEGNEKRYQSTIVEREKLIVATGGEDLAAFPPGFSLFYVLWDFFTPAFTCPFPMYRVGTIVDGGKWVCGLERVLQDRPNCIIYSLNYQAPAFSSFEQDMLMKSPGCRVYGFDSNATDSSEASTWPWNNNTHVEQQLSSRVHSYNYGVADRKAEQYRSLQGVMSGFGHDFVDIVKVDLEGGEFETLLAIIEDSQGNALPFGQLLLEAHVGWSDEMATVGQFRRWFMELERAGLRPFYFEVSAVDVNTLYGEPSVVYWSFMNIRGRHALLDDSLPEYP